MCASAALTASAISVAASGSAAAHLSWTVASAPTEGTDESNSFSAVTCAGKSDCWAVGSGMNQPLIARNAGSGWSFVASPQLPGYVAALSGVACVGESACWAVGSYGGYYTLIEQYDGTAWTTVTSPNPDHSAFDELNAVACASATDCWAVGDYIDTQAFAHRTLLEHYDGTGWSLVNGPIVAANDWLYAATCVGPGDCWAAGVDDDSRPVAHTLVEHYAGGSWVVVPSADVSSSTDDMFNGIACVSDGSCWAVGSSRDGTKLRTLVERYDGAAWAILASPNTNLKDADELSGISCVNASDCWAVGSSNDGSNTAEGQTLIEHYNGTRWRLADSPDVAPSPSGNLLVSVTCTGANQCWSVGSYHINFGADQPLILHRGRDTTTTTVSCTPPVVPVNSATTCTATVTDNLAPAIVPSGTVAWGGGTGDLSSATCALSDGTCSVTFTPAVGSPSAQTIQATYQGGAGELGSQGTADLTVTLRSTTTALVCAPNPDHATKPATCTVTVADSAPGTALEPEGAVHFSGGAGYAAFSATTCTLSGGSCAVTYTPPAGSQSAQTISAAYGGDAAHATSAGQFVLKVR
jgi:hypothetical protein